MISLGWGLSQKLIRLNLRGGGGANFLSIPERGPQVGWVGQRGSFTRGTLGSQLAESGLVVAPQVLRAANPEKRGSRGGSND